MNGTIVIAGGSGFLGIALAHHFAAAKRDVVILSRSKPIDGPWTHAAWDGRTLGDWKHVLNNAAAVINLAGRSVNCLKTPDHQDEILRSRVESTRVLGEAMRTIERPPPVWVQMGTAHIYGDPPTAVCDESSPFGVGLAPTVGMAWEAEFERQRLPSQRGVVLRTSFVIGPDRGAGGGALSTLSRLARFGLGGRVGRGTQGMSWLHELDFCRMVERAIEDASMSGAFIASSPSPMPQVEFMRELRRAVGMPIGLPSPAWLTRFGAKWLMRTDPDLALYGRFVVPRRLIAIGFEFRFPELPAALKDLC